MRLRLWFVDETEIRKTSLHGLAVDYGDAIGHETLMEITRAAARNDCLRIQIDGRWAYVWQSPVTHFTWFNRDGDKEVDYEYVDAPYHADCPQEGETTEEPLYVRSVIRPRIEQIAAQKEAA